MGTNMFFRPYHCPGEGFVEDLEEWSGHGRGYDVKVVIDHAKDLPESGAWGETDPFVVVYMNDEAVYRTNTKFNDENPQFDEYVLFANIRNGTKIVFKVEDKDYGRAGNLGQAEFVFNNQDFPQDDYVDYELPIETNKGVATLFLMVHSRRSQFDGRPRAVGPVRYFRSFTPATDSFVEFLTGNKHLEVAGNKLYLMNIPSSFQNQMFHWNRDYSAAQRIFSHNPVGYALQMSLKSSHAMLYATAPPRHSETGVLHSADDFFRFFEYGQRGGEMRYFTYAILADSMRCSETGKAVLQDMLSKHAMHASCAEEVYSAGEFCIVPSEDIEGGYVLVIDNNSGTYSPSEAVLPRLEMLFKTNFPDMEVLTLHHEDPRLKEYHAMCPTR